VGLVVLKRLSRAIADNDRIYAIIRGSAVNSDGRSSGSLGTPSRKGQETMLRRAYTDAGVLPGAVQYVEAHGTGTRVGDPVELNALGAVLNHGRGERPKCRVGSVKTNIGHTEGAAGIAGLIKVALALSTGLVPPSLHHEVPNPSIPWPDLPLEIQRDPSPWPIPSEPPVAGVSAFGIGGTNAHVVLEQHRPTHDISTSDPPGSWRILTISSHTPETFEQLSQDYERLLRADLPNLDDVCYTATARRRHHAYRRAAVGRTRDEIRKALRSDRSQQISRRSPGVPPEVISLFPDIEADWAKVGLGLMKEWREFCAVVDALDAVIGPTAGWSVGDVFETKLPAGGNDHAIAELARLFVQVALAKTCTRSGVMASTAAGWGRGAISAAHHAGAISLADAVQMVCNREAVSSLVSLATPALRILNTSTPGPRELRDLAANPFTSVVDVGPPSTFTSVLRDSGLPCVSLLSVASSESVEADEPWPTVLRGMASLYELGHDVDWRALVNGPHTVTSLPPYRWNRQRFWMESKGAGVLELRPPVREDTHQPDETRGTMVNRVRRSRGPASTDVERQLLAELEDAGY
jgi:acyl transferase domain-containing protein